MTQTNFGFLFLQNKQPAIKKIKVSHNEGPRLKFCQLRAENNDYACSENEYSRE